MSIRRLIMALTVLVLGSGTALAATDDAFDLRYVMYYGGFQVAELTLRHQPNGRSFDSAFKIKTTGLVDTFLSYRGRAEAKGSRLDDGRYRPGFYESRYKRRGVTKKSVVRYDPATGDVLELSTRKRGRAQQTEVPEALRRGVVDPLTAFLELRRQLAAGEGPTIGRQVRTEVFDGRRRYTLSARVEGREQRSGGGRQIAALRLAMAVEPVAGFDADDLEEAGARERGYQTTLLLSDDERLIPLEIRTRNTTVAVIIRLREDCSGNGGCTLAAVDAGEPQADLAAATPSDRWPPERR